MSRITSAALEPQFTKRTVPTGLWLWIGRLGWLALTLLVLLTLSQMWPENYWVTYGEWVVTQTRPAVQTFMRYGDFVSFVTVLESLSALTALLMGFLVFWYKSNDKMGLFVSAFLILSSPWFISRNLEMWRMPLWMPFSSVLLSLLMAATLSSLVLFFYLFPDGRFVPRWTRWIAVLVFVTFGISVFGAFFNILSLPEDIWILYIIVFLGSLVVAGTAQFYRYRTHTDPVQRQQMKWVVFGFGAYIMHGVLTVSGSFWGPSIWGPVLELLGAMLTQWFIPLAIGFSILRYRLWDIDLIINRTVVYGMLTALVVGLYVSLVGAFSRFFRLDGNPLIAILVTGLVAILFEPLRRRLQRGVDRLMYGEQHDPVAVLSKLGARLEEIATPETMLVSFVETLARSLKLPYVAIWSEASGADGEPLAVYGTPTPDTVTIPFSYQGESVRRLVIGLRGKSKPFSIPERQLLETVAQQMGTAVHALRLTADLQQSRERLVTTREEERRRLGRDLHDGLGPQLAALTLKVDAARNYLHAELETAQAESIKVADHLLIELKGGIQEAIQDIRQLAYELRPPALDQLGLVPTLREVAAQNSSNGLHITVDAPAALPVLPAAVEVAAYRIAMEAITNVVRHAHATHCTVQLTVDEDLCLKISDNGVGLPGHTPIGVGLASMRERTAELGGRFDLQSRPGEGTLVSVCLSMTRLNR